MVGLENIVNQSKIKLNYFYKKFKYLTLLSLIPLSVAFFDGCKKDSPTQPISSPKNKPPIVRITQPTNNNFTITTNDAITFRWEGADEDGRVVKYRYGISEINEDNATQKTYSNLRALNYRFSVRAQDDKREWSSDDERLFTVQTYVPPIGPTGNTNSSGYVKIQLGSTVFDFYVKNLSNQPLNNIKVSGADYGTLQGFLAEDFSYNYLSEIYYTGGYGLGKSIATLDTPEIILRAKANNEARARKIPSLKNNKDIDYLGVSSFSDIKVFYQEYDIITNLLGISYLEYLLDNAGKKFAYPIRAAKFREDIIENASNYGKIVNQITTSLAGRSWDADALYLDVWKPKVISVLSHYFNEDKLCTLKGKITDINNQPISGARVSIGILNGDIDSNGNYVIKSYKHVKRNIERFLREGTYTVTASATNYILQSKNINLVAATPQNLTNPYVESNILNFQLNPVVQPPQQITITLQPGPEGKDAYVAIIRHPQNPCFFYCNDNYGGNPNLTVLAYVQQNQTEHLYRGFLQPDLSQVPSNATINSAILYVYGDPTASHNATSSVNVKCKEVLGNWLEGSITWNNQPSLGNELDSKTINYNGKVGDRTDSYWESWNVTSLVQQWVKGQKSNYGISLTTDDAPRLYPAEFFMNSSDNSNSSLRPKWVITYTR